MKTNLLSLILLCFLLKSCSPKTSSSLIKTYPALGYEETVTIIELNEKSPENAEILGEISVGDTGFSTKCNYETVLDKAQLEARRVGGNAIKITKHKKPDLWSSCHRIKATILKTTSKLE